MSTGPEFASPEVLLAHRGFLHGLARSLVFGDEQADDYVQETLAYALARPPREGPGLKSWLAKALRNFVRQDRRARGRRIRREEIAAVPEAEAATTAVDRERARRRVVDAVFRLPEPYRSVVVLRYLDDRPPREIARELDVPVETVRTRLKRALSRLRADLDSRSDGDRRSWCLALLPLIDAKKKAAAASLFGGGLIVTAKHLVAAAVLLVLLALGAFWAFTGRGPRSEGPADPGPGPIAANPDPGPAPAPEPDPEPTVEPEPTPPAPTGALISLSFVDENGDPISADAARRMFEAAGLAPEVELVSDAALREGSQAAMVEHIFGPPETWRTKTRIEWTPDGPVLAERPDGGQWRLLTPRPGATPILTEVFSADGETAELRLPLPRNPETIRVQVVDGETGTPVAGATVTPYFEYGDDQAFFEGPPLTADPGGFVEIPVMEKGASPTGRQPTWWAESAGRAGTGTDWKWRQPGGAKIGIWRTAVVRGRAWLSTGEPAAGYPVVWARKGKTVRVTVAPDGTFEMAGLPAAGPDGRTESIVLLEDVKALKVGLAKVRVLPGAVVEATIGNPASDGGGVLIGRVRAGERPVPDVGVFLTRGKGGDPERTTVTDAKGEYRFENLPPEDFHVILILGDMRASDDFLIRSEEPLRLGAGEKRELSFDLPGGVLRLTVLDEETRAPVRGAIGYARATDEEIGKDRFPGFRASLGWAGFTGDDGTILLPCLPPGTPIRILSGGEGYAEARMDGATAGTADEPTEVTIRLRRRR